ncbi:hypothetical protein KSC_100760 [Ktedonobacter sp. SOSP1-52]|nr:hypothetical protein KSC_100760 [Ktedonobacter sp. SOSP1-52]
METIAESPSANAYREYFTPAETLSMWQSLAFQPNYKAAYCMAVCPVGEDVIGRISEIAKSMCKRSSNRFRRRWNWSMSKQDLKRKRMYAAGFPTKSCAR